MFVLRSIFVAKSRETAKAPYMYFVQKILFFLFLPSISIAQSNLVVLSLNKIQFADRIPGTDPRLQTRNAIAALPANGREVGARGFSDFSPVRLNSNGFWGRGPVETQMPSVQPSAFLCVVGL